MSVNEDNVDAIVTKGRDEDEEEEMEEEEDQPTNKREAVGVEEQKKNKFTDAAVEEVEKLVGRISLFVRTDHERSKSMICCMEDNSERICGSKIVQGCFEERQKLYVTNHYFRHVSPMVCHTHYEKLVLSLDKKKSDGLTYIPIAYQGYCSLLEDFFQTNKNLIPSVPSSDEINEKVSLILSEVRNIKAPEPKNTVERKAGNMKDTEDAEDSSFGEEEDYSSIFNPSITKFHFTRICVHVLNNCQLPSYMPNCKMAARGRSKPDSRNLMGLLIWKHMTGKLWVKTTALFLT